MHNTFIDKLGKHIDKKENVLLTGLSGTGKSYVLHQLLETTGGKILCLMANDEKVYDLARDLQAFVEPGHIFTFVGRDLAFMKENYTQVEVNRILTLKECLLHPRRQGFIITSAVAWLYTLISPQEMKDKILEIRAGQEITGRVIFQTLVEGGYNRAEVVSRPGEFAVRGGLLDIFPVGDKQPCRLEFFGDNVESIRRFDPDTQRSGKKENLVNICPADELIGQTAGTSSLLDYLPEDELVFFDEVRDFNNNWERAVKRHCEIIRELHKDGKDYPELALEDRERFFNRLNKHAVVFHALFPSNLPQVTVSAIENISQQDMQPFFNNMDIFYSRLQEWQGKGYHIQLAIKSKTAQNQIKKELIDHHLTAVEISDRPVEKGFINQSLKTVLVSEKDLWGKIGARSPRGHKERGPNILIEELKIGNYIVHESYGIGIFRGITCMENDGIKREYILLHYAGTDKLYLPLDKLDLLHRYSASDDKPPRLSKLGGSEWERTRKRVTESIQEMAQELLLLYASRQAQEGYAFAVDTPWQRQFEEDFPYSETPDQLKAIEDVKRDMENSRPMDRLICGDVGYGKTEVAMRAAFKAIMDGKQVAILVPTTVLAEQHYHTFKQRFTEYPTVIEALSRFRSPAEQRRITAGLKTGMVDIIIGTHRLLSKDIHFKDLGLLIIDEEHRFGVAQKEKIKTFKQMVDVVSLSATPIPRSLHMSLTGLRDMSIIETPPPERYPITTYVLEYNEEIIVDAVVNEMQRGGQVFFVHNRIEDIYHIKDGLQKILPSITIAVGHGRLPEDSLARVMMDFMAGKYQVFLCTTIIESGLDMPNVNTIIINEADKMGLAQLYQLRGRVGRSHNIAYAYLTYRRDRVINEIAQKRLNAIKEFNELGAGIKIALKDLEIRGAGNILGREQHGHIQAVGFDMYCRLLEQETVKLKGGIAKETANPQVDVDIDYYIPDGYITDSGTKLRIYRRLVLAADSEEIDNIRAELADRFGPIPPPVENFLQISTMRITARDKEIKALRRKGRHIEIQLGRKLPQDFAVRTRGLNIKMVNDHTLLINREGTTLGDLQGLLNIIY